MIANNLAKKKNVLLIKVNITFLSLNIFPTCGKHLSITGTYVSTTILHPTKQLHNATTYVPEVRVSHQQKQTKKRATHSVPHAFSIIFSRCY